jgi:hypothetical protein
MKTYAKLLASFVGLLCAFAVAQDANNPSDSQGPASSPVAYVYVSSSPTENTYQINVYSANSSGQLTAVTGSPFPAKGGAMALTSAWFFNTNGVDIYTSSISSTGALKQVSWINARKYSDSGDAGGPYKLFLDHTGATLYDFYINLGGTGNSGYQSFDLDQQTGKLSYTGATPTGEDFQGVLSFIGNNVYAYGDSCYHGTPIINGFSRSASGTLTDLDLNAPFPPTKPGVQGGYCPGPGVATDTTNHIAVPLTPNNDMANDGPTQLGVYTADSSGNLTTSSTYKNMPTPDVGTVNNIWAAPSGMLLAVAGTSGLEVYHYNGAKPLTKYTGLLTTANIAQVFWDNANHLYALSTTGNELFVFTVTPTSFSQAAGSPYTITSPAALAVLPE